MQSIPGLSHSEILVFERFRSRTVVEIAGARSSGLWQNVVLPACYSEPAVLHASIALVTATRWSRDPQGSATSNAGERLQLETVSQYNKAIQSLKAHVTKLDDPASLRITLITCVLFIALELCTERILQAMIHLDEGRKLTSTLFTTCNPNYVNPGTEAIILPSVPQSTEDELLLVFADLDVQSTYFGSARPQFRLAPEQGTKDPLLPSTSMLVPPTFHTIEEANQHLIILTNKCLDFVGDRLEPDRHTLQNRLSNLLRQDLSVSLKTWRTAFQDFVDTATKSKVFNIQSAFLQIRHAWLKLVIVPSYSEVEETILDAYLHEFASIVQLASMVLSDGGRSSEGFTLEFGVVAPLWFTVMKCRHPQIRRQALHLLTHAPREGFWDPNLVIQLGRETIKLEEGVPIFEENTSSDVMPFTYHAHDDEDETWRHLVPLYRRIAAVEVSYENEQHPILTMTFKRKTWTDGGRYTGMESIVVSQPLERRPHFNSVKTT